jgi:hypothetical protein
MQWVDSPKWDAKVGDSVVYLPHPNGVHREVWSGQVESTGLDFLEGEPMFGVRHSDGSLTRRFYDGMYGNPGKLMVWRDPREVEL